jgi:hypothetical protein
MGALLRNRVRDRASGVIGIGNKLRRMVRLFRGPAAEGEGMTSETTHIKNLITSHLRGALFGMEIYGQHKIACGTNQYCVLQLHGSSRFEKYGSVVVYHPLFGKWLGTLNGKYLRGTPVQVFTVEQICAQPTRSPMIAEIYGIELDTSVVVWDAYNL